MMPPAARSFRLEMLQVARLAPKVLGDSATLVQAFLRSQLTPEGAFADRAGRPDLYYTVFGLEGLRALQVELPEDAARRYVQRFGDGAGLDFVHLCSLARCAANLGQNLLPEAVKLALAERIERFRTLDGGFHGTPGKAQGSAYGALLAWGAYADLGLAVPALGRLGSSLEALMLEDGSFANEPSLPQGTTTATAAAVTVCRQLGKALPRETGAWLLQQVHPSGGFMATPQAPLPDLLSTATALHALQSMEVDLSPVRDACLDFVDSLWSATGGFHGHWADDDLDVEYTSYGLLALGHLS
ncbi:MAG: prenyltransferase/squalene oxidase repeat-containing protein [Roseimicrobium sp.]